MVVEVDRALARGGRGASRRRERTDADRARDRERRREKAREAQRIIGVDGEGEDRVCGECVGCDPPDPDAERTCTRCKRTSPRAAWPNRRCPSCNESGCLAPLHIYTYLAAVDDEGTLVAEAYNADGLTHEQCCEMLLSLPSKALKFGFMFSYDVTKIIEGMPPEDRFYLMRPKLREKKKCDSCKQKYSRWRRACPHDGCGSAQATKRMEPWIYNDRKYDFFNGSLTIKEIMPKGVKGGRSTKVWDCFRFFGCAFVDALRKWGIGSTAQVDLIAEMKNKRGSFDTEDPEAVKNYCREECHLLALMMQKLIVAHDDAGISLTRYEGAGSTATSLLKANDVGSYKGPKLSELETSYPGLAKAIACAFFGGRFEDSMVGLIDTPVDGYDISSAYPFALSKLPCLGCGGEWGHVDAITPEQILGADLALVHFRVRAVPDEVRKSIAWCPLPCRDEKGSISYGLNFSGWAWAPEVLAALRGWPELVEISDAWVYKQKCDHFPFHFLPPVYRQRVEWGKEGKGEALKLGSNAPQPVSEPVLTPSGWRTMGELRVGDAVIGADGRPTIVLDVYPHGERDVYTIHLAGGQTVRCDLAHHWEVLAEGQARTYTVSLDEMLAADLSLPHDGWRLPVLDVATGECSYVAIERVERTGREACLCIRVSAEDHLYVSRDHVVTHNSYGKTAQSLGDDPPFQSWIWAGVTTATTRGQLLDGIASAKDRWNVLTVATDGIYCAEPLPLWHRSGGCRCVDPEHLSAPPRDTGTGDLKKPLGGWEHKELPEGIFVGKPGLYWRLFSVKDNVSEEKRKEEEKKRLAELRARGVGRREVLGAMKKIEDTFLAWNRVDIKPHEDDCDCGECPHVRLTSRRFFGAKHSIHGYAFCEKCQRGWTGVREMGCPSVKNGKRCGLVGTSFEARFVKDDTGADAYGRWAVREIKVGFDPYPKRERTGLWSKEESPRYSRLFIRDLDGRESRPYDVGALDPETTPEGEAAREDREFALEQPDWDELIEDMDELFAAMGEEPN